MFRHDKTSIRGTKNKGLKAALKLDYAEKVFTTLYSKFKSHVHAVDLDGIGLEMPMSYYQKLMRVPDFVSQVLNPDTLLKYHVLTS